MWDRIFFIGTQLKVCQLEVVAYDATFSLVFIAFFLFSARV